MSLLRRSTVWAVLLLLTGATVLAQGALRISTLTYNNRVVVSFELNDAYDEAVRDAIASGLRTSFTYTLELRTPAWILYTRER